MPASEKNTSSQSNGQTALENRKGKKKKKSEGSHDKMKERAWRTCRSPGHFTISHERKICFFPSGKRKRKHLFFSFVLWRWPHPLEITSWVPTNCIWDVARGWFPNEKQKIKQFPCSFRIKMIALLSPVHDWTFLWQIHERTRNFPFFWNWRLSDFFFSLPVEND